MSACESTKEGPMGVRGVKTTNVFGNRNKRSTLCHTMTAPTIPRNTRIHSFVDMKRVAKVGKDAFSLRDIVRMLRNDAEKTQSLKEIMLRSDIDDAKKLELAAALV